MRTTLTKILLVAGALWALCVTLPVFLLAVLPLWALGRVKPLGIRELAWVWVLTPSAVTWVSKLWWGWAGITFGNIVVLRDDPTGTEMGTRILSHELVHVRQYMKLGPLFLPLYGLFYLVIRAFIPGSNGYYDNPFEVGARRQVGQFVDVWGAVQRLKGK